MEPKPLTFEDQAAIRKYVGKLFVLPVAVIAAFSFFIGFLIQDVAMSKAELDARKTLQESLSVINKDLTVFSKSAAKAEVVLDNALNNALKTTSELKAVQKQAKQATEEANNIASSLTTRAEGLTSGLDKAKVFLQAVGELKNANNQIVDQLLSNEQFNASLINSIYKKTSPTPTGMIMPFIGSKKEGEKLESLGWFICDGRIIDDEKATQKFINKKSPDIQGRFLLGSTVSGKMGGSTSSNTNISGDHTHGKRQVGGSGFGDDNNDNQFLTSNAGSHKHKVDIIPPYYSVIYLVYVR